MPSPGLKLAAIPGNGVGTANAGLCTNKVKGNLLSALITFDVRQVLVFMDTIYNTAAL